MKVYQLCYACLGILLFSACSSQSPSSHVEEDGSGKHSSRQIAFKQRLETETGITFFGDIEEDNTRNYFLFNYIYIGGGVAAADFNQDGLEDLYFISNTKENRLYINQGDFRFKDITSSSGVALPGILKTGVTIVDINQDGLPDIYQCVTGELSDDRKNRLLINNGDLTFSERAADYGLALENPSTSASFFDYDRDGDLDVYIINRPVDYRNNDKVRIHEVNGKRQRNSTPRDELESDVFLENVNGSYTNAGAKAGIANSSFSLSVLTVDFNTDGYVDIYVANDYIEPDQLYINNQDGTFSDRSAEWFGHTAHSSMGSDIADLNGDGLPELMTVDMMAEHHYRQFTNVTSMQYRRYATLLDYGYQKQIMRNVLQKNNGNETFSEVACFADVYKTDWSWGPLFFYADNDPKRDLFITNGFLRDVGDLDYNNYTIDSLQKSGLKSNRLMDALDLMPSQKQANYFYENTGELAFTNISEGAGFSQKTFSNGAVYVDLNNDGKLDLAVHNNDDYAGIYQNVSAGNNYLSIVLRGKSPNLQATGAKVSVWYAGTRDITELQPTRGFFSSQTSRIHFGLGETTSVDSVAVDWSDGTRTVVQNIQVNQQLEIEQSDSAGIPVKGKEVVAGQSGVQFIEEFETSTPTISHFETSPLLYRELSNEGPIAAVADLNGDGLDDIYLGGNYGGIGRLAYQEDGDSWRFDTLPFINDRVFEDGTAVFFDLDDDGDLDLYVGSSGTSIGRENFSLADRIYIQEKGKFSPAKGAINSGQYHSAASLAIDVDADGDLDLLVGHHSSIDNFPGQESNWVYLNSDGVLSKADSDLLPGWANAGMVNQLHSADLYGDMQEEILAVGEWMAPQVFGRKGNVWTNQTTSLGLADYTGLWFDIIAVDIDLDGDKDLIAGNIGLNTRLEASEQNPLKLTGVDFDQNGKRDPIVFGVKGTDRYLPYTRREELIKSVPLFAKRYPRYKSYARAQMSDFFRDHQTADVFEASVLASTIFLQENGKFRPADNAYSGLPAHAQYSALRSLTTVDINADGTEEVVGIGNIFGMEIHGGSLDAGIGVVLKPSANGARLLSNQELNFFAQGDTRSVHLIKTKAGQKLLILRSGAAPMLYDIKS